MSAYNYAFRAKRLHAFLALADDVLRHKPVCRVLDVGGAEEYWSALEYVWRGRNLDITVLNVQERPLGTSQLTYIVGDARDIRQFPDNSFDIVHSNSVIEHVGRWADMRRMAGEVRRLAPFYFVQTPNYWFPYEAHALVPFIHWLPRPWQQRILMARKCGFYPRATSLDEAHEILSGTMLLNASEMTALFPDARIVRERLGPLTKSLTAIRHGLVAGRNVADESKGASERALSMASSG